MFDFAQNFLNFWVVIDVIVNIWVVFIWNSWPSVSLAVLTLDHFIPIKEGPVYVKLNRLSLFALLLRSVSCWGSWILYPLLTEKNGFPAVFVNTGSFSNEILSIKVILIFYNAVLNKTFHFPSYAYF